MIIGPATGFTPRPYQEWALEGGAPHLGIGIMPAFARYQRVLAVLPTGCHRRGQLVLRADGTPVPVEKVKVLDTLLGPDGRPRVVLRLNRGRAPMYEVRPVKGEPFVVDRDHILTLWKTPTGRPGFEPGLVDVSVGEWLAWGDGPKHLHKLIRSSAVEFDRAEQVPLIPAYIVGVLIGDGSMKRMVRVSTPDPEIQTALRAFADSVGLETKIDSYPGKCPDVRLSGTRGPGGNHILTEIGRLGLKVGSLSRRIPDVYKFGTVEQRLQLLAGLIDTDGCLANPCCVDYLTGSPGLADDILFIARSLGFAAYMRPCEKRSQDGAGGTYYRISISGDLDQLPCRVERRQSPPRRQKKNHLCTGFTIVPTGTVETFYGFTLDEGDHRYLLGDFTITHNCGKTETFLSLIRRYLESPKTDPASRVLVLSHRDELVTQPIERAPRFGMRFARDQGKESGVGRMERVVSTTIQSMSRRMNRYKPGEFGLIILDEAHHAAAEIFQKVLDYFSSAYVLGVTATPSRLDGVALGEVFQACAFEYAIDAGVADGWLVPVKPRRVIIDGLDLNKLRVKAGDLEPGALGELMAEYAHPVAQHLVKLAGGRSTIVFCCTVAHAHAQAAALRRYTEDRVEVIDGETDKTIRKGIMADFKAGRVRYLVNCEIATEGLDAPMTACVAMVRPTKSQGLMTQMIGRGTRPEPGCVDKPHLRDDAEGRRAAIAASAKPDLLVLDFSGVCEKHSLANPADVLAGKLTPEERLMLGKIDLMGEQTVDQLVAEARKLAAAEAARVAALDASTSSSYEVDPFNPAKVLSLRDMPRNDPGAPRCSEKMATMLTGKGIAAADKLSAEQAQKIAGSLAMRAKKNLCTYRQALALQKAGIPAATTSRMFYDSASKLMTALVNNGYRRPKDWEDHPALGGRAPARAMVVPPLDLPRTG